MKLTGKKSAKRAVNCKFCYSKIKIRWPKVPGWVKQCWAQQLLGNLVTVKTYSRSFWNLIEIILGEFSWNCIISVHVEVQKEKEKFAIMCLRRGVHKTSHKIIGTLSKDDDHGSENYGKKSSKGVKNERLRRETSWFDVLWRTWTYDDEFSFLFFNLTKILKNSTPGKVACIWHIERVQMDAIKFKKT